MRLKMRLVKRTLEDLEGELEMMKSLSHPSLVYIYVAYHAQNGHGARLRMFPKPAVTNEARGFRRDDVRSED